MYNVHNNISCICIQLSKKLSKNTKSSLEPNMHCLLLDGNKLVFGVIESGKEPLIRDLSKSLRESDPNLSSNSPENG